MENLEKFIERMKGFTISEIVEGTGLSRRIVAGLYNNEKGYNNPRFSTLTKINNWMDMQ